MSRCRASPLASLPRERGARAFLAGVPLGASVLADAAPASSSGWAAAASIGEGCGAGDGVLGGREDEAAVECSSAGGESSGSDGWAGSGGCEVGVGFNCMLAPAA